jgi:hypothetical protein
MQMSGLATLPIRREIHEEMEESGGEAVFQLWYADDSAAAGSLSGVLRWLDCLRKRGPDYGYFVEVSKSILLVKKHSVPEGALDDLPAYAKDIRIIEGDSDLPDWEEMAKDAEVSVSDLVDRLSGVRYLGAGVGDLPLRTAMVKKKVTAWTFEVDRLALFAKDFPRQALSLFQTVVVPRWRYVFRTTPVLADDALSTLSTAVKDRFLPSLFGFSSPVIDAFASRPPMPFGLAEQAALPPRHGGLGVPDPVQMLADERLESDILVSRVSDAILSSPSPPPFMVSKEEIGRRREERLQRREIVFQSRADRLEDKLTGRARAAFAESRSPGASDWLSALPLVRLGLNLEAQVFRDFIMMRFGHVPFNLPKKCPSCGKEASLEHLLSCKLDGWVSLRHKELNKAWAAFIRSVGLTVSWEPFLPLIPNGAPPDPKDPGLEARADLGVVGLEAPGRITYLDARIVDTLAPSYVQRKMTAMDVLESHERIKMRKYESRVAPSGTFVPLVMSVYGTFAPQAHMMKRKVVRRSSPALVRDDDDPVVRLHSAMLQVACFRAVSLGLRGRGWMNPSGRSKSRPSRTRLAMNAFEVPVASDVLAPCPDVLRSGVGSCAVPVTPPSVPVSFLPSGE